MTTDRYIVEIALTHDHDDRGRRTPDYFQAFAVPLADYADAAGEPLWDEAVPVTMTVLYVEIIEQDTGFDHFCELVVDNCPEDHPPERFDFSLEGENDCAICAALIEIDLRSQGRVV